MKMAGYKVKNDGFSADEIASFEALQKEGKVNVILGKKADEACEVEAQGYYVSVTCGAWGHGFAVWVPGPGVYWTVCPYCGHGGWTTVY